jgi:hypothetical protein
MANFYELESGGGDTYLLEDGTGSLLLEEQLFLEDFAGWETGGLEEGSPNLVLTTEVMTSPAPPFAEETYVLRLVSPASATRFFYRTSSHEPSGDYVWGAYIRFTTLTGNPSTVLIGGFANAGNRHIAVRLDNSSNGNISLLNSAGSVVATASGVVSANTWHRFELKWKKSDTDGTADLFIDGISRISVSGQNFNTTFGPTSTFMEIGGQQGIAVTPNTVYVNSCYYFTGGYSTEDFLGEFKVIGPYQTTRNSITSDVGDSLDASSSRWLATGRTPASGDICVFAAGTSGYIAVDDGAKAGPKGDSRIEHNSLIKGAKWVFNNDAFGNCWDKWGKHDGSATFGAGNFNMSTVLDVVSFGPYLEHIEDVTESKCPRNSEYFAFGFSPDIDFGPGSGILKEFWGFLLYASPKIITDDIDLFVSGSAAATVITDDIDLFIRGHITNTDDIDLFIHGFEIFTNSIDLFINGYEQEEDNVDLFIKGKDQHTENIDLFIRGKDTHSDDCDLFVNCHETEIDNIDLFIKGIDTESDNIDLFAEGKETETDDIDLFIYGLGLITDSIDLFIKGYQTETDNIDLFINGHQTINDSIDLFIHGNIQHTEDIDLYIEGKESNTDDYDLFIHGYETNTDDIDLFVKAHETESDSIDLYIDGLGVLTDSLILFVSSINLVSDDIHLFIKGIDTDTDSINLFVRASATETETIDLFIEGFGVATSGIDLFVMSFGVEQDDIDLFIDGFVTITDNIDLVVSGIGLINDSITFFIRPPFEFAEINFLINGFEPLPSAVCFPPDPNAAFQIPNELVTIYQENIDALVNQLGKNILIEFDPIITDCPNCEIDNIRQRSRGIYKIGGPVPFSRGQQCPYCKGNGQLTETPQKCIKALIKWNPKELDDYGISVADDKAKVRVKTFLTDFDDLVRARTIIVDYDQRSVTHLRARRIGGINPIGLREDRYCISYWELI